MNHLKQQEGSEREKSYFKLLKDYIKDCNRELYSICNLFEYYLTFENYKVHYNQSHQGYDEASLERATMLNLMKKNFGQLNIKKLLGSDMIKVKTQDVTEKDGKTTKKETRVSAFSTFIERTNDGGLTIL